MNKESYKKYVHDRSCRSPVFKNCIFAFLTGGCICTAAQFISQLFINSGMSTDDAGTAASITLILMTAVLTGFGVFDNIAKAAGGGTIVPITGFANAVTAAAVDSRSEGFIMGVGAKMFTVAGPVIVYGISAGTVYGFIYWIINLF